MSNVTMTAMNLIRIVTATTLLAASLPVLAQGIAADPAYTKSVKDWRGELPYTIIVDETGKVIYRERGELSFLAMRRAIVPELNRLKPWGGLSPIKP